MRDKSYSSEFNRVNVEFEISQLSRKKLSKDILLNQGINIAKL